LGRQQSKKLKHQDFFSKADTLPLGHLNKLCFWIKIYTMMVGHVSEITEKDFKANKV